MSIQVQLTIFFEEPFWVGIFEINEGKKQFLCKLLYGKQPTDPEIYRSLIKQFHRLTFIEHKKQDENRLIPINPKRKQRLVNKMMKQPMTSSKSQQILKDEYEKLHQQKRKMTKQFKEEQKEQLYLLKQQKRKEKHKGH